MANGDNYRNISDQEKARELEEYNEQRREHGKNYSDGGGHKKRTKFWADRTEEDKNLNQPKPPRRTS